MILRLRPAVLVFASLVLAAAAPAAATAPGPTGSIGGRVQNTATGRYLGNARVALRGSELAAFTDDFGEYRLSGVPAGTALLEVFYTGLDPRTVTVTVPDGGHVVADVGLTSAARYGAGDTPVRLGAFVVASAREKEGEALATNEQRFAPNLRNVVAIDSFGDVQEGNLGEFVKFLPGVAVNYGDAEAQSVSLRGFAPNLTGITTDGAQVSNANYTGSTRTPFFSQTSINGISRVEVTKVPTPASAADALGGSINMVPKSAFERSRAEFRYRLYLTGNSHRLRIRDPYTFDNRTHKILPSFDFDYTLPVSRDLGFVVTGLTTNYYNEQRLHQTVWTESGAGTGASIANPFLSSNVVIDAPRFTWRKALGLGADWRVAPNAVLSAGFDVSDFHSQVANVSRSVLTGTTGTPTFAGGTPFSHGPTFTVGAAGRGAVNLAGNSVNRYERTVSGRLRYRFDNGPWRATAALSRSSSNTRFRGGSDGWIFTNIAGTNDFPVRATLDNIRPVGRGDSTITPQVFDNANRAVDLNDFANYRVTTATISTRDVTDAVSAADATLRRRLGLLGVPAAVQIGALVRTQARDSRLPSVSYTYNGVNGNLSAKPYQYQVYVNQDSGFGARNVAYLNVGRASRAFRNDPGLFSQTLAQRVAGLTSIITTSEAIDETVRAGYAQLEAQLFGGRLRALGGVRREETEAEGIGPFYDPAAVYLRTATGAFVRNAAGQRVRRPEAGAAGSLEELALIRRERGNRTRGGYAGNYPSLHLTGQLTPNLQLRAAWARTYGRPNFNEIIPNVVINERDLDENQLADPSIIPGFITLRNPGLRPWTARNVDLSLEHYTPEGGVITAGVFRKDIRDFFANDVRRATADDVEAYGLDPRYVGFEVTTKVNKGNARVSGAEFSLRHGLGRLGAWGRPFSVFFNATKLRLEGDRLADFSGFIEDSRSWGVTFTRGAATVMAKWNWRAEQRNTAYPAAGPDGYNYLGGRTHLDLNLDWQLSPRISLFANGRNVFDVRTVTRRYGSQTPTYARDLTHAEYGVQLGAGLRGSF